MKVYLFKEKYLLLKNFRELKPKKQKAILWLLSRLGKSTLKRYICQYPSLKFPSPTKSSVLGHDRINLS